MASRHVKQNHVSNPRPRQQLRHVRRQLHALLTDLVEQAVSTTQQDVAVAQEVVLPMRLCSLFRFVFEYSISTRSDLKRVASSAILALRTCASISLQHPTTYPNSLARSALFIWLDNIFIQIVQPLIYVQWRSTSYSH